MSGENKNRYTAKHAAKDVAMFGVLVALSLILSYIEAQIPVFAAVPGMKIGLTNIVVVSMLYAYGEGEALLINIVRILLVAILFGNGVSIIYSLAGGIVSYLVMIIGKRVFRLSVMVVSTLGAVFHNVAQVVVAMILLNTSKLSWYMLILWFTGIVSGLIIGFLSSVIARLILVNNHDFH